MILQKDHNKKFSLSLAAWHHRAPAAATSPVFCVLISTLQDQELSCFEQTSRKRPRIKEKVISSMIGGRKLRKSVAPSGNKLALRRVLSRAGTER